MRSAITYKVIFWGETVAGIDQDTVKAKLQELTNLSSEKAEILFSGKPVVIKNTSNQDIAEKLQGAFSNAGAICSVLVEREQYTSPKTDSFDSELENQKVKKATAARADKKSIHDADGSAPDSAGCVNRFTTPSFTSAVSTLRRKSFAVAKHPRKWTLVALGAGVATTVLFALSLFYVVYAVAPVHECDRLAASPLDTQAVQDGVPLEDLNASAAERACAGAVSVYPKEARFYYQYGRIFDKKEEYDKALSWYRASAQKGYAAGQRALGELYRLGKGLRQDYAESAKWHRKAAEQGDPHAQGSLGFLYDTGKGANRNHTEATKWYRKAAQQGKSRAQFNLGVMYYTGRGVARDFAAAAKWFRQAAEQGDSHAQFHLALLYDTGQGVIQNEVEAAKWYEKAAEHGLSQAQFVLGMLYDTGKGVDGDHKEAEKWYRKAAEQGDSYAQFNLALLNDKGGGGVKGDYAEAAKWYRKAAEQGNLKASVNLALLYHSGRGVKQDYAEVSKWFRNAAEQGLSQAQYNLGVLYDTGKGVERDYEEAAKWYRKAAEQGNARAQFNLALLHYKGKVGVRLDLAEAGKWFRRAAEQGDGRAASNLRYLYGVGRRVDREQGEARKRSAKAKPRRPAASPGRRSRVSRQAEYYGKKYGYEPELTAEEQRYYSTPEGFREYVRKMKEAMR